jgi:hypothetical protein
LVRVATASLSELYRSKANSSERQFGADDNAALASFWETALKCQRLSVALQHAVYSVVACSPSSRPVMATDEDFVMVNVKMSHFGVSPIRKVSFLE